MSAAAGGNPANAALSIDGFQSGDNNSTLPPKSSIGYIKVNSDLFSSEYRNPPFHGGQIEVYTKPGQPTFHGAIFGTNSSAWMNARDPFSVILLSYPYWQQRFGGTPSVIGTSIIVGGLSREIIGILPQDFHFLDQKDPSLILPMRWDRTTTTLGNFNANAIALLKPGVGIRQATTDLASLLPVVAKTFSTPAGVSDDFYRSLHLAPNLIPLKKQIVGNVQTYLLVLLASTILVLFVACANVANLLIAQIEERWQEFALRYVIGGVRKNFSSTILVESALLGLAGSLIGLLLAFGTIQIIIRIEDTDIPRIHDIGIAPPVLLFSIAIAGLVCRPRDN